MTSLVTWDEVLWYRNAIVIEMLCTLCLIYYVCLS